MNINESVHVGALCLNAFLSVSVTVSACACVNAHESTVKYFPMYLIMYKCTSVCVYESMCAQLYERYERKGLWGVGRHIGVCECVVCSRVCV